MGGLGHFNFAAAAAGGGDVVLDCVHQPTCEEINK